MPFLKRFAAGEEETRILGGGDELHSDSTREHPRARQFIGKGNTVALVTWKDVQDVWEASVAAA